GVFIKFLQIDLVHYGSMARSGVTVILCLSNVEIPFFISLFIWKTSGYSYAGFLYFIS
ncbi:hypothetical protein ACJX0J_023970, partial [Zea mays]